MPPPKMKYMILSKINLDSIIDVLEYISWDPGEMTGVVCWDANGKPLAIAQMDETDRDAFLDELRELLKQPGVYIKMFIIEEYRIYGSKANAHIGQKLGTAEVIGDLKSFARRHFIKVEEQAATILTIAQKWSGVRIPKTHSKSHWASAFNHGYYYLHRMGIIPARVLGDT
jgi:hypothetical protein